MEGLSHMTKGFITIATGKEEYYLLARNLLHSYHHFCKAPLPFAILCDRMNEYALEFDDVIVYKNGATNSYLDKLSLGEYLPYDENIFIDADCLAYGDLNSLFDYFQEADDFSCFGRVLSLTDKTGWFEYENLGELKKRVTYVVGLHGGIYYMRKSEIISKIFDMAKSFIPDYSKYNFKGKFNTPGDEPLIALSMAINNCHPIPFQRKAICCYWEYVDCMSIDITEGKARIESEPSDSTILLHWGTRYTRELEYQRQIKLLEILEDDSENKKNNIAKCIAYYDKLIKVERRKKFMNRVKNKVKRTLSLK